MRERERENERERETEREREREAESESERAGKRERDRERDRARQREVTDADLELHTDVRSVYQIFAQNSSAVIKNRRGSDIFTQKIAYGSRKDIRRHGGALYVCHPQYNNLPYLTENEQIVMRPDIVCALPPDGMSPSIITECVCGIIARTYTIDDTM